MKRIIVILVGVTGLLLAVVVGVLLVPMKNEIYRDRFVSSGELCNLIQVFAVHLKRVTYLSVSGRTFKNIRGMSPYFLSFPLSKKRLFVYDVHGRAIFVIFDETNGSIVEINAGTTAFGEYIGTKRKPGEVDTDYIASENGEVLILKSNRGDRSEALSIDLSRKSVTNLNGR